ncbi:MAG: hypothetical protein SNH18_09425 [Rikenellaceae bacterium]
MREIIYKGEARPIHFGLRQFNEIVKEQNLDFQTTVSTTELLGSFDSIVSFAIKGLNNGARRSGIKKRYDEDEVWDMFEEEPKLLSEISAIVIESIQVISNKLGDIAPNQTPTEIQENNPAA